MVRCVQEACIACAWVLLSSSAILSLCSIHETALQHQESPSALLPASRTRIDRHLLQQLQDAGNGNIPATLASAGPSFAPADPGATPATGSRAAQTLPVAASSSDATAAAATPPEAQPLSAAPAPLAAQAAAAAAAPGPTQAGALSSVLPPAEAAAAPDTVSSAAGPPGSSGLNALPPAPPGPPEGLPQAPPGVNGSAEVPPVDLTLRPEGVALTLEEVRVCRDHGR